MALCCQVGQTTSTLPPLNHFVLGGHVKFTAKSKSRAEVTVGGRCCLRGTCKSFKLRAGKNAGA